MHKNQAGFSLWNVVLVGAVVLLSIVYGRHVINIHYNAYSLTQKAKDVVKEMETNKEDKQVIKLLRTKAEFDKQGHLYEDSDVNITRDGGSMSITITYRDCANINENWEICADEELSTK